jgi:hypothetical protein
MGRLTNLNPSKSLTETDLPAELTRDSELAAAIDAHTQGPDPHRGTRTFGPTTKSIGTSTGSIQETFNPLVNRCGLEVQSSGGAADAAYMSFHRPGAYALHFGLDNNSHQLSVGGWSMGPYSYRIYHEGFGTPVWQSPSDSRLKQNIRPLESALDIVLKCQPVHFEFKAEKIGENTFGSKHFREKRHYGFIAQDFPLFDLVFQGSNKYLGIDYIEIIPFLVRALQEQQEQIKFLETRLEIISKA